MTRRTLFFGLGAIVGLLLLYLLFWPVPIDPASWTPPEAPELSGVYQPNNRLDQVELLAGGVGHNPEALFFDEQGQLYTGFDDGRIMRFTSEGENPELIVNTGGKPQGLEHDQDGNLIVADTVLGLLSITPQGDVTVLANEAGGRPLNFTNDLAIAGDGMIYFTDSSSKFGYEEFVMDLMEHQPNGRFLSYDPASQETRVLIDGLHFANGVAISPDQSFLLVAETWRYRVWRYWLTGPEAGEQEIFIENLPGMPDNITSNGVDTFWLALVQGPGTRQTADPLLSKPFLRKVIVRLPDSLMPAATLEGYVLGLDQEGQVTHNLQDPEGDDFPEITSAIEHEGFLYLGSLSGDAIGRVPVP